MNNDITFQIFNWWSGDADYEMNSDNSDGENLDKYLVKIFGRTMEGKSVSVNLLDYTPFFYVKWIKAKITEKDIKDMTTLLRNQLWNKNRESIIDVKRKRKKDFYGFKNNEKSYFLRYTFSTLAAWKNAISVFSKPIEWKGKHHKFSLYESNIEPHLRLMHIRDIEASGWVRIKAGKYNQVDGLYPTHCDRDVQTTWTNLENLIDVDTAPLTPSKIAPMKIASFDIECTSSHGDFPVARKTYSKLANEILQYYNTHKTDIECKQQIYTEILKIFDETTVGEFCKVFTKNKVIDIDTITDKLKRTMDDIYDILKDKVTYVRGDDGKSGKKDEKIKKLVQKLGYNDERKDCEACKKLKPYERCFDHSSNDSKWSGILPQLEGDTISQIGTTVHNYGDTNCQSKFILTIGSCDDIPDVHLECCQDEKELLLKWRDLINHIDPDIITGYNILGFDFEYMYGRAQELNITRQFCSLSRIREISCKYIEKSLSSSALGDNLLKYIDMEGRVIIDVYKVIQRDHKLDSYKLDNVANHFMNMKKNDVTPNEIFSLFGGSSSDRKQLAEYCVQDCVLCNNLIIKLEIIANNIGMSNVCNVPFSYIFTRGQGIKIFSLVAKQCKNDGFVIPSLSRPYGEDIIEKDDDGYEGAIVLEPKTGIYLDHPVSVLDYASLYPSSMISENLSHDSHLLDKDHGKYDNIPGISYVDITYDKYKGKGDSKVKIGEETRRFAQTREKGVLPRILMDLLKCRKETRSRMAEKVLKLKNGREYTGKYVKGNDNGTIIGIDGNKITVSQDEIESVDNKYDEFQRAVLDGLQLAYKVTANSLYGQTGSKLSPIYMKEIAACTTATGRNLIMQAKQFMEKQYNAETIYGDTDSIFIIFPNKVTENGKVRQLYGKEAINKSIETSQLASKEFKSLLKAPHDLEYEKTYYPFMLMSKKRYCANKYEFDDKKYIMNSMGIVMKRRDNANIVKRIYGGILDIILNKLDINLSVEFLKASLRDMIDGKYGMEEFIISKTLKSSYVVPARIAHKVLADRMAERDIGSKPQVNDRLPYAYIEVPDVSNGRKKLLQGERIEHPDYIREKNLKLDYMHYIECQIMMPVIQLYALILDKLEGNMTKDGYFAEIERRMKLDKQDNKKIKDKLQKLRETLVQKLLFDPILNELSRKKQKSRSMTEFYDIKKV